MIGYLGWCWHNWGNWEYLRINYVNMGFQVDGQIRHCKKCNKEQTRVVSS